MTPNPQDSAVALEVELLPCPFCGGDAHTHTAPLDGWFAGCNICDFSLGEFLDEANAIAAWNTRASQSDGTSGVPDGWQLVPVEPTVEMLSAGAECWHISKDNADGYYRAMLAAAPTQGENHVG